MDVNCGADVDGSPAIDSGAKPQPNSNFEIQSTKQVQKVKDLAKSCAYDGIEHAILILIYDSVDLLASQKNRHNMQCM